MRNEEEYQKRLNEIYNSKDFGHYIKFLSKDENNPNRYWYFCEIHQQKFQRYKTTILNGFGCNECKKDRQKIRDIDTYLNFIKIFKERYPNWKIKSWYRGLLEKNKTRM